ncbi:MAG TPA: hypothetical protein PLB08_13460 [Deltaproteobacteria bacterium]|jgi:hypothetical protein|nr:hypothetical protein [Deltaproteobacteria bacterium]
MPTYISNNIIAMSDAGHDVVENVPHAENLSVAKIIQDSCA